MIMRIGVLDDNLAILDYVETILTLDNHSVTKHTIGSSLLAAIFPSPSVDEDIPYDLVILDLLLPGKYSGADVFITIRQSFPVEYLPIIVITAVGGSTLDQFRQILPDDVPLLRKPFSPRVLRQLIAKFT
jgi:DNA-binding response OmpR family regulator